MAITQLVDSYQIGNSERSNLTSNPQSVERNAARRNFRPPHVESMVLEEDGSSSEAGCFDERTTKIISFLMIICMGGCIYLIFATADPPSETTYTPYRSRSRDSSYPYYIKITSLSPEIFKSIENPSKLNIQCTGAICKEAAQGIIKSLNTSVDPCNSFYDFACQGWQKENPKPEYMADWSVLGKLEMETVDVVADILNDSTTASSDMQGVRQASQYFKSCVDLGIYEDRYGQNNKAIQLMLDTLEEYGGWPMLYEEGTWTSSNFDLTKSLVGLMRYFDSRPILDISPLHRPMKPRGIKDEIIIRKPSSEDSSTRKPTVFLPKLEDPLKNVYLYQDFIVNITTELLQFMGKTTYNKTYLEFQALIIIYVQSQLIEPDTANVLNLNMYGFEYNTGNMTLWELQELLDRQVFPYKNELDLFGIISKLFANVNINIYGSQNVVISDASYVFGVAEVLSKLKKEALANFLHFYMVLKIVSLVPSQNLQKILQNFKMLMDGTTEPVPRQLVCAILIEKRFPVALGYQFILHKNLTSLQAMDKSIGFSQGRVMFNNIKYEYNELIASSNQLTYFDKTILRLRLQMIDLCTANLSWVNYKSTLQNEYSGLILKGDFLEQTKSLNAWIMDKKLKTLRKPETNSCKWTRFVGSVGPYTEQAIVYLPLGILQPPFFSTGLSKALVYGKLGSIIGHELAHGLVGPGWTTKRDGSLTKMSECLIKRYENFTFDEVKNWNITLDAKNTLTENAPDNAGLLTAYKAYRIDIANGYGYERNMEGLGKYTDIQLFYIGFAQNWCKSSTLKSMQSSLTNNVHSPGRFRVLGTLQNSQEFARAWKCPAGSKMNPRQTREQMKCKLF